MKIKTIDINGLEWFDKINGNSYFAGTITVNLGMKSEKIFNMPYQGGYDSQYIYEGFYVLHKAKVINIDRQRFSYWQYCRDNNIILRTNKHENCLKRELTNL